MTQAHPLQWPEGWKRHQVRTYSKFKTTFGVARDALMREVRQLGGQLPVLSTNVTLRNDGLPYSGMRPGCGTRIPREMYACKGHWYSLPPAMRDLIMRGYHARSPEWSAGHAQAQEYWKAKDQVKQLEATAQGSLF